MRKLPALSSNDQKIQSEQKLHNDIIMNHRIAFSQQLTSLQPRLNVAEYPVRISHIHDGSAWNRLETPIRIDSWPEVVVVLADSRQNTNEKGWNVSFKDLKGMQYSAQVMEKDFSHIQR